MRKLNNRGSALQIVLTTFIIMTFALTSCLFLIQKQTHLYQSVNCLMKQKNIEIFLVEYYVKQMKDGFLFSDYYEKDGYRIQSYVDDMGSFYEITTRIQSREMNYEFLVQIEREKCDVLKFEYMEV